MKKEVKIIVAIIIAILVVVIGVRVYKTTKSDENKARQEMNAENKKPMDESKAKTEKEKYLIELNNLESTTDSLVNGSVSGQKQAVEKWDNELDKISNSIDSKLEGKNENKFENDENEWEKSKDDSLTEATQETSKNEIDIKMTKERCYYLVNNYMK